MIRHGETTANRDGLVAGRWDVPLTETGRAQARALTKHPIWVRPIFLVSSPLSRALDTARLAFPHLTPLPLQELSERNWGLLETRPLAAMLPRAQTPEGGEAWEAMILRVQAGIRLACLQSGNALPVLVCHSGVIRAARLLAGRKNTGPRPANATPILFRWTGQTHEETTL